MCAAAEPWKPSFMAVTRSPAAALSAQAESSNALLGSQLNQAFGNRQLLNAADA